MVQGVSSSLNMALARISYIENSFSALEKLSAQNSPMAENINNFQKVFDEKLSVRDVEKLVKNLNKPEKPKKEVVEDKSLSIIYQNLEEKLKQTLGTKVAISSKGNGAGKIEIEFYTHDDLDRITDLLSK